MRGFTLLEVIIYLALFALLMSGFLAASFSLIESSGKDTTHSMVEAEGDYLLAKINWALASGTPIDPTALVSGNIQLSNVAFYIAPGAGSEGVRFTLTMPSLEGRVVSEDFFSTTTI